MAQATSNIIDTLKQLVRDQCKVSRLNEDVISALITVESAWNPKRARFEKRFFDYGNIPQFARQQGISEDTETMLQKTSWGLMQLMGATARSLGYLDWLPDLCDPAKGIHWGCEYYRKNAARYVDVRDQIAAYNAGSVIKKADGTYANQDYVNRVLAVMGGGTSASPLNAS